jgi:hypothetical protein
MPRIPESEIERIKSEVSLVRLAEVAGVKLTKRGKDYSGCCPFHDDKTPSFIISPEKNLWNCLGACGEGGDVISFVRKVEGVSFRYALELLRDGYAPDATGKVVKKATVQKLEAFERDESDSAMLTRVTEYYHNILKDAPEGLAYLEKRGLTHPDLVDTFKLGLSNRTLGYRLPAKNRKAGADVRGQLQKLGVYRKSGHEHLAGSLVVPIIDTDPDGNLTTTVRQLYGRKILDNLRKGTPKHLYLPGPMAGIWNAGAFKASDEMILCESLIDAMTFWCAGYRNVTCAYGINGLTDDIVTALSSHNIKRVLIAYDRDAGGETGAQEASERLTVKGLSTYRLMFPKGMDANEYALQVTPARESFGALIRGAKWLGNGPAPKAKPSSLAAELPTVRVEPSPEMPEESLPESSPEPPAPETPLSTAIPQAADETDAIISDHEILLTFADRHWRVRGLARNTSYEALRINLLVSRDLSGAAVFHVDTLDLYAARQRTSFTAQAASELGLSKETVKSDMARILLKLEALQEAQIEAALTPTVTAYEMTADEKADALTLLKSPDILTQISKDAQICGVVGESANLVTAYLASISRKLSKPLAVLIQSTSAAGKSALMDAVLAFIPEEEQVSYAAMTGQALFYLGETALKRKVLAIAEEEGARDAAYALKLLQSQGDLSIASTGKDPVSGKLVTQDYRVEGPVALMMTTTAIDLDEELKNRCLVLSVNEGQEQTRAIHERQRFEETLEGLMARQLKSSVLTRHQNAQRLLKPLHVVNPYAGELTFLSDKTRTRRDHRKYLGLIRAIALLHQYQRPVKSITTEHGEIIEYVEATLDDIAKANLLAADVLGRTLDELAPQTRRLLDLIVRMVTAQCEAGKVEMRNYRFTRRDVREATGWGLTQLKVHLRRLEELEYLITHMGGRGRSYVYELAYNSEGEDGAPFLMGLIDVEKLKNNSYDEKKAGVNGELAGHGRPQVGGKSGHSRASKNGAKSSDSGELVTLPPKPLQEGNIDPVRSGPSYAHG